MEPISGLEPETSSLPRKCSTAELYGQSCYSAASQLIALMAAALRPRRSHKYLRCATVILRYASTHASMYSRPVVERVIGIEPTSSAWKAGVLPLNYTRTLL